MAEEFSVPHHYADYRDLLANHALDLVSLALPPTANRDAALAGGGTLFHTTVHLLDAALWALGNPRPIRASAISYQRLPRMPAPPTTWQAPVAACDIEDFNIGLVLFANGSTMTIESNWLMHPRPRQSGAELLGDHGTASLRPLKL